MTHTFDYEVSLHSWLLWPRVHRADHVRTYAVAWSNECLKRELCVR